MSQQLINLNSDLKQLRDEGYQLEIYGGHLVVRHIPYVTHEKKVELGTLICDLTMSGNKVIRPSNHVMMFAGSQPCNTDGTIITGIQHQNLNQPIGNGLVIQRSFSNKPRGGYSNYFDKVKRYADIISAPANYLDKSLSATPFEPISTASDSVFQYYDTNSSRANIDFINQKLVNQKIAIVGLGGTGSYILDLVAKTCVAEIHLFDGDDLLNHNAFRSPGAISIDDLKKRPTKVDYYKKLYSNMRRSIFAHAYYLDEDNYQELEGMDYVFICIDDNAVRCQCIEYLRTNSISFIDVGLGVNVVDDELIGMIRVTAGTKSKSDHISTRIPNVENEQNDYSTNIQIAELNAFNATQAVIKWKKLSGFYQDLEREHHSTYSINVSQLLNEDSDET